MTQKNKCKFFERENVKIKPAHAFKGYGSTYNVEILNYFNPGLQLKDAESAIKSKLIELLSELRGFRFMPSLVLLFKKLEREGKNKVWQFLFKLNSRNNYQWK